MVQQLFAVWAETLSRCFVGVQHHFLPTDTVFQGLGVLSLEVFSVVATLQVFAGATVPVVAVLKIFG